MISTHLYHVSVAYDNYRGVRDSYYKGTFFVAIEEMDCHLKAVNYQDESVSTHSMHCMIPLN